MFADLELIGIPHHVGERGEAGPGRYVSRREGKPEMRRRARWSSQAWLNHRAETQATAENAMTATHKSRPIFKAFSVPLCLCGAWYWLWHAQALAGAQRYEPLAASVRAALHSAVADRASPRLVFATPDQGYQWLDEMSIRLARGVPDQQSRLDLLTSVQYEAKRAGLDPQLVLGLIEVESGFRKYAVSRAGARGYMQVMPFWVDLIGTREQNLFNLRTNLRYGCVILRHYLDVERGDLTRALARSAAWAGAALCRGGAARLAAARGARPAAVRRGQRPALRRRVELARAHPPEAHRARGGRLLEQ
jgi:soluble lytic murein transglycosylase-like protein